MGPDPVDVWRAQHAARGTEYLRRIDVAVQFIRRHFPSHRPEQIVGRLRGIDFSRPVTVHPLPKGTRLTSYRDPRVSPYVGSWFTPSGTPYERLGLSGESNLAGNPLPRDRVRLEFVIAVAIPAVLESTAAATIDNWSLRFGGRAAGVMAAGGGRQFLVPNVSLHLLSRTPFPK